MSSFVFQSVLSYLCFCSLIFSCVFVQHEFSLKRPVKKHQFLVKMGVATKRLFNNLCFAKCEKLSFLGGGILWQKFGCSKNTVKLVFCPLFKAKKGKTGPFLNVIIWAKRVLSSGPSLVQHKHGQLGPDNTIQKLCAQLLFKNRCAETPICRVLFDKQCSQKNRLGTDNNTRTGHILAVKLRKGPVWGLSNTTKRAKPNITRKGHFGLFFGFADSYQPFLIISVFVVVPDLFLILTSFGSSVQHQWILL